MPRGGAARSARVAHNHKVAGSNPAPATMKKVPLVGTFFMVMLRKARTRDSPACLAIVAGSVQCSEIV